MRTSPHPWFHPAILAFLLSACSGSQPAKEGSSPPVDTEDPDTDDTADTDDPDDTGVVDDADGDGVTAAEGDCDDSDPTVHPGAEDAWYDGIDSDCNGSNDFDQDLDGFDASPYGGQDCDDLDPEVNPLAADTWYDGVDSDCDGASDFDSDGDGFDSDAYGGDDCNDEDPAISPGAHEIPDNEVDEDCSGRADHLGSLAGRETPFGESMVHPPNFLLGHQVVVSKDSTLTAFGTVCLGATDDVVFGLYADRSGAPDDLVAQSVAGSCADTTNLELEALSPADLEAGSYWLMALYADSTEVSMERDTHLVEHCYEQLAYTETLPTSVANPPDCYTAYGAFDYYILGY